MAGHRCGHVKTGTHYEVPAQRIIEDKIDVTRYVTTCLSDKEMPQKRDAEARAADFDEIYGDFSMKKAEEQASRCSQCGVPFCQVNCPLHNNIPDWLMLTAENRLEEAYELSSATNTFPEICGRICPQDRLCEGNCVIEKGFESVTIGAVEKYITETAFDEGWVKPCNCYTGKTSLSELLVPDPPDWQPQINCAAKAIRSRFMTDMTVSADC